MQKCFQMCKKNHKYLCQCKICVKNREKTDLGNKYQTEGDGATKDDHQSHNAKLHIRLISGQKRHRSTNNAHDAHVVDAHSNVFAVIESGDANVPGLPCQETAKQLQGRTSRKVKDR